MPRPRSGSCVRPGRPRDVELELTEGTLLGGRVIYRQPRDGFRTGIEPVLLAASIGAQPGERVLEAGTGAGAGMLCLLARLPDVAAVGIERDGALAALAQANLRANAMKCGTVQAADLLGLKLTAPFDHAMANPPWHGEGGTASPDPRRDAAKRATPALLSEWATALSEAVRPGGSVTLIVPAASTAEALAALADASCGSPAILPLWPRAGQEARLVLLRAVRADRGRCRLMPGLVLHEGDGYSALARRILWDGDPVEWPV